MHESGWALIRANDAAAALAAPGVQEYPEIADHTLKLEPGSMLFLFTDGAVDRQNAGNDRFGEEGLLSSLRRASKDASSQDIISCVRDDMGDFAGGVEQTDDITMLCLRYNGGQAGTEDIQDLQNQ